MNAEKGADLTPSKMDQVPYGVGENDDFVIKSLGKRLLPENSEIGQRIAWIRRSLDYTQKELAEKCRLSLSIVKNIESESRSKEVTVTEAMEISRALGVSIELLCFGVKPQDVQINYDLGLTAPAIEWLKKEHSIDSKYIKILNHVFQDSDTISILFEAFEAYINSEYIPFITDSEGLLQVDVHRIKQLQVQCMETIEEAMKRYLPKRPRYDEALQATREREAKRWLDRMVELRVKLKEKNDEENEAMIAWDEAEP